MFIETNDGPHQGILGVTQACTGSAVTIRRNLSQTNMPSTDA